MKMKNEHFFPEENKDYSLFDEDHSFGEENFSEFIETDGSYEQENWDDFYAADQEIQDENYYEDEQDDMENRGPAEGFSLKRSLRKIGKVGGKIVQDPRFTSAAAGFIPGGQFGLAAINSMTPPRSSNTASPRKQPFKVGANRGPDAAAKLAMLLKTPNARAAVLQSLKALVQNPGAQRSIQVNAKGDTASTGAVVNLLKQLITQIAEDAESFGQQSEAYSHTYLLDDGGNFRIDPANPEARADALYESLMNIEA